MATIVLDATKVINAAKDTIKTIEAARTKRDEAAISRTMLRVRRGAWFKLYNPTRQQAIKLLDNNDMFGWRIRIQCLYACGKAFAPSAGRGPSNAK